MADYDKFKVGNVTFPLALSTATNNAPLADADPALFFFLDFAQFAIAQYVGARIVTEASNANLTNVSAAVAGAYPYEPTPEFLEAQLPFPLVFAHRTRGQTEQFTIGWDEDVCGLEFWYVLPPLDSAGMERMVPLLHAVYDVVRYKTSQAWDPAYTPGALSQWVPPHGFTPAAGDVWTTANYANVSEVGFGRPITRKLASVDAGFGYGKLPGVGDLWFPSLHMRGYIIERDAYAPTQGGPSKFQGADLTGNVLADDGTKVLATSSTVSQASSVPAPTVTGLLTTSGPATGGTPVTIEGTGFLPGPPVVFFGPASDPQYAASVAYQSAGLLVVVTPPMQGAGTVDVSVQNRDGQQATLPQSFTFQ